MANEMQVGTKFIPDTRAYLAEVNVLKLNSAAKMAGLRWKNGNPEYTKQGIIEKLHQHPSILRATLATLERMDSGTQSKPINLLDDLEDETEAEDPRERSESLVQETPKPAVPFDGVSRQVILDLRNSIDNALRSLGNLERSNTQDHNGFNAKFSHIGNGLDTLVKRINELEKRAPIQINIPAHTPIQIDPNSCHESYPKLIKYLQINRRVILVGSAGTGKSMAVKNAAEALGVDFYLVPPVTMSHELIGHRDAQGVFHETPLFQAYTKGGLCLLDEADASLPDALLCANPILDGNGFATFGDGNLHKQHPDFFAVFNMNTDGNGATMQYAGRNRLDGATVARFGVRIQWNVDPRIERAMCAGQDQWYQVIQSVRAFMEQRQIVDVNATPRHAKTGAALLNAGLDKNDVLIDSLKSGALAEVWSDVLRLPAVNTFIRG